MVKKLKEHMLPQHSEHIDKKILFRIRLFFLIFFLISAYAIYDTVVLSVSIWYYLGGLVVGLILSIVTQRMHKITYNETEAKVVARMDRLGGIILIVYILFSILRTRYLENFVPSHGAVILVTLGIVAGNMFGRAVATRNGIKRVLKKEGIWEK